MTDAQFGFWLMVAAATIPGLVAGFYAHKYGGCAEGVAFSNTPILTSQKLITNHIAYVLAAFVYLVGELLFYPFAMTARTWGSNKLATAPYVAAAIVFGIIIFLVSMFLARRFLDGLRWLACKFLSISIDG